VPTGKGFSVSLNTAHGLLKRGNALETLKDASVLSLREGELENAKSKLRHHVYVKFRHGGRDAEVFFGIGGPHPGEDDGRAYIAKIKVGARTIFPKNRTPAKIRAYGESPVDYGLEVGGRLLGTGASKSGGRLVPIEVVPIEHKPFFEGKINPPDNDFTGRAQELFAAGAGLVKTALKYHPHNAHKRDLLELLGGG
jgi:hypothetical protein